MTNPATTTLVAEMVALMPRLRHYARALLHDRSAIDDAVQDALLRGIANQHQFQPGTDLRAWLFTIMHNQVVSSFRRNANRNRLFAAAKPEPTSCQARQDDWLELSQVHAMVLQLRSPQRELLLASIAGSNYEELAIAFEIPVGTVRSRLNRARGTLKKRIAMAAPQIVPEPLLQ